jgi:hypothetical protein
MLDQPPRRAVLGGLLVCFFLSGAAGLIYQVAWGKALGLVFGHTAYAVATVLAVFMGGLAAGSAWLGRWSERTARPIALYGWIETGLAATGAVSLAGLAGVRAAYVAANPLAAGHGAPLVALRFVGAALVLFPPTFLMGGTLPILVRGLARNSAEVGTRLARLYWVNTAGAVAGTLAAGFVILPMLAAITSRWFWRNAFHRFLCPESFGACWTQRETVRSETSNPSICNSPWMREAPQVGFSATMRKMSSRSSLLICFLPVRIRCRERQNQYSRKPARCQRTTVSGLTRISDRFQPVQNF